MSQEKATILFVFFLFLCIISGPAAVCYDNTMIDNIDMK